MLLPRSGSHQQSVNMKRRIGNLGKPNDPLAVQRQESIKNFRLKSKRCQHSGIALWSEKLRKPNFDFHASTRVKRPTCRMRFVASLAQALNARSINARNQ